MENWRAYLSEAEDSDIYGNLYLFEGDEVSNTSFYAAINTLSESDDDTAFLPLSLSLSFVSARRTNSLKRSNIVDISLGLLLVNTL